MERKEVFQEGEYYHLYSRGVEKRDIFTSISDRERFLMLLLLCNSERPINISNVLKKYGGEPSQKLMAEMCEKEAPASRLVGVVSYALMPNHLHIVVQEREENGISKFMLKLMTAYSMYFNTRYDRSGPLFTRPFRSRHIDSDDYFRWLFAYVHLNPLDLMDAGWKERGLSSMPRAGSFLGEYRYSSYSDYFGAGRPESRIIEKALVPFDISRMRAADDLIGLLAGRAAPTDTSGAAPSLPSALVY